MTFENSPKSLFVYNQLSNEKAQLQDVIVNTTASIGAASTIVEDYKIPPASLDQIALQKIVSINSKKQQIVTIVTNNYNQYAAGISSCGIGTTTSAISGPALNVVIAGTATTFSFNVGSASSVGVRAEVREDELYSWTFPAVESANPNVIFYDDGAYYQKINSGNLGIGKTTVISSDVSDVVGIHSTSNLIGYYYPIVSSIPSCVSLASSVTNLINEIVTIRSDITNLMSQINTLKNRKTEKQLEVWYETSSLNDTNNRLSDIQSSINAMETNEQIISAYET